MAWDLRTSHLACKPYTAQTTLSTASPAGSVLAVIEAPKGCLSGDLVDETEGQTAEH